MYEEKCSNELWLDVKRLTSLAIAGSPRNIFRYSLGAFSDGGRALDGLGDLPVYQTQPNSEYRQLLSRESVYGR